MHWRRDDAPTALGERTITEQDRTLYGLLRPERLLEMVRRFIIYDAGVKKIARHQQVAAVKSAVNRVLERDPDGARHGGLIWHTQGSGKSLTMVMLAKALALHPEIPTPRLILVTDRVELDKQIADTFKYCGYEPQRARDGKHLRRLLESSKSGVITTIINKFEAALKAGPISNVDENTFVLVDGGAPLPLRGLSRADEEGTQRSLLCGLHRYACGQGPQTQQSHPVWRVHPHLHAGQCRRRQGGGAAAL